MHRLNLDFKTLKLFFNKNRRKKYRHKLAIKQVLKKLREREHMLLHQINGTGVSESQEKNLLIGAKITHQQRRKGINKLKSIR